LLNHRLVIALHSPDAVVETELRDSPPEKQAPKLACGVSQYTFSGPVAGQDWQNCGVFQQF
jgi:hypothetical protein